MVNASGARGRLLSYCFCAIRHGFKSSIDTKLRTESCNTKVQAQGKCKLVSPISIRQKEKGAMQCAGCMSICTCAQRMKKAIYFLLEIKPHHKRPHATTHRKCMVVMLAWATPQLSPPTPNMARPTSIIQIWRVWTPTEKIVCPMQTQALSPSRTL